MISEYETVITRCSWIGIILFKVNWWLSSHCLRPVGRNRSSNLNERGYMLTSLSYPSTENNIRILNYKQKNFHLNNILSNTSYPRKHNILTLLSKHLMLMMIHQYQQQSVQFQLHSHSHPRNDCKAKLSWRTEWFDIYHL